MIEKCGNYASWALGAGYGVRAGAGERGGKGKGCYFGIDVGVIFLVRVSWVAFARGACLVVGIRRPRCADNCRRLGLSWERAGVFGFLFFGFVAGLL